MFNNWAGKNNYEEGPALADLYIILLQDSLKVNHSSAFSRKRNTKAWHTEESDSLTEKSIVIS